MLDTVAGVNTSNKFGDVQYLGQTFLRTASATSKCRLTTSEDVWVFMIKTLPLTKCCKFTNFLKRQQIVNFDRVGGRHCGIIS